jgi:cellulose biosynthesis protein BcsQ
VEHKSIFVKHLFEMHTIKLKFAVDMSTIYIVANGSTRSGKSTTAFNLAVCFATLARKTLLVNLNQQNWITRVCSPDSADKTLHLFLDFTAVIPDAEKLGEYDKVLINCPVHAAQELMHALKGKAEVIIPVELEYYGLNTLPAFLECVLKAEIGVKGILPVMWRKESAQSTAMLKKLQQQFGSDVFVPAIQRNYYLSRQKDFLKFDLPEMTEKAAVTYLNLATELLKN